MKADAFLQHIIEAAGKALAASDPRLAVCRALVSERIGELNYLSRWLEESPAFRNAQVKEIVKRLEQRAAVFRKIVQEHCK